MEDSKKKSLYAALLAGDPLAEPVSVALECDNRGAGPSGLKYRTGVYYDGIRPGDVAARVPGGIPLGLRVHQCRASDEDPFGTPEFVAELGKRVIVNFAGTLVTADEMPVDGETEVLECSFIAEDELVPGRAASAAER